jgi:hypothetical protein
MGVVYVCKIYVTHDRGSKDVYWLIGADGPNHFFPLNDA